MPVVRVESVDFVLESGRKTSREPGVVISVRIGLLQTSVAHGFGNSRAGLPA